MGLTSSTDLAREEEGISKKKAVELFENGVLDTLLAGKLKKLFNYQFTFQNCLQRILRII